MPSSSRKRGAQVEDDNQIPVKRSRKSKRKLATQEQESEAAITDHPTKSTSQVKTGENPAVKRRKGAISGRSKEDPDDSNDPVKKSTKKTVNTKTIQAEAPEVDLESVASPKKTRKRIKTETIKAEEVEEHIAADEGTPKKAKQRKAVKQEGEAKAEAVDGEDTTPNKPKRKRKTQEDKDAEAMPLAARTTGLKAFIGAHVSGAKGESVTISKHVYRKNRESDVFRHCPI